MSSTDQPSAPLYPNEGAFVIKFRGSDFDEGEMVAGCVEHLVSGRGCRFNSTEQMLTSIREMIALGPILPIQGDGKTGS